MFARSGSIYMGEIFWLDCFDSEELVNPATVTIATSRAMQLVLRLKLQTSLASNRRLTLFIRSDLPQASPGLALIFSPLDG